MQNLSLYEVIKNVGKIFLNSKVSILLILELAILLIGLLFYHFMNKKIVKTTCISSSLIILGFYLTNYYRTVITFINNVSTKLMEIIYFPTTLELISIMLIAFIIMIATYIKSDKSLLKVINTIIPFGLSFLFLNIIEYINTNNIAFDEFSVFTEETITSLYECAMIVFFIWIIGLIIYRVDCYIINRVNDKITNKNATNIVNINNIDDEYIEMPKLKVSKTL